MTQHTEKPMQHFIKDFGDTSPELSQKFEAFIKSLPPNWGAAVVEEDVTKREVLVILQAPGLHDDALPLCERIAKNPDCLSSLSVFSSTMHETVFDDMLARVRRTQAHMDTTGRLLETVFGIPAKDIAQALFPDSQLILSWMPKTERASLGLVMGDLDPKEVAAPFGFEWCIGSTTDGNMQVNCRPIVCMNERNRVADKDSWEILNNRPWYSVNVDPDAPGDLGLFQAIIVATSMAFDSAIDVATKMAAAIKSLKATKFGMLVDRMTEQKRQELRSRN